MWKKEKNSPYWDRGEEHVSSCQMIPAQIQSETQKANISVSSCNVYDLCEHTKWTYEKHFGCQHAWRFNNTDFINWSISKSLKAPFLVHAVKGHVLGILDTSLRWCRESSEIFIDHLTEVLWNIQATHFLLLTNTKYYNNWSKPIHFFFKTYIYLVAKHQ